MYLIFNYVGMKWLYIQKRCQINENGGKVLILKYVNATLELNMFMLN